MVRKIYRLISGSPLLLLFFVVPAFSQDYKDPYLDISFNKDIVLATVDSIKITAEEFYLSYEFGPAFIKRSRDPRKKHLEYMINEKLLALEGYERNIDTSEEASSLINDFRNDLATEELFRDSILSRVNISENETESVINQKKINIKLKWLFSTDEPGIRKYYNELHRGISFDSIFFSQLNDSVSRDDRTMDSDLYKLRHGNPALGSIIDSLKPGSFSNPIHTLDGWYIVMIDDLQKNMLASESEYQKLKQEAVNALAKEKMDSLSDIYVNTLISLHKPRIKSETFNLLRSYIGIYNLPPDKFKEWGLAGIMDENLAAIKGDINNLVLVILPGKNITLKEYINWYRNRSLYIKLDQKDPNSFSYTLEKSVWRMLRDRLLSDRAEINGYCNSPGVKKQLVWWKDKIVGSAVRNQILQSLQLNKQEVNASKNTNAEIESEFQKKMLHEILALKQKYKVNINYDELYSLPVSEEYDPKAIELYIIKNGGLIPRTPYPTINNEWVNWE